MAKQCITRRRMKFSAGLEISACRRVERCFPTRFPPEGRSERDTLVGVLVAWNRGRYKISLEKVAGGRVFQRLLWLL